MTFDPQDLTDAALPVPTTAAYQLADAISLFTRSLARHDPAADGAVDLGEIAAVLNLAFDSMYAAMESAATHAGGSLHHPPAEAWNRAVYDALNLRDHLGQAVPDGFDWDRLDRWLERPYDAVHQRLKRLRVLRQAGSGPVTGQA